MAGELSSTQKFAVLCPGAIQGASPKPVIVPGAGVEDTFTGTSGNDNVSGTDDADVFFMGQGGRDRVAADAGDDQIFLDATFAANDKINGGSGQDIVTLEGDYSDGVVFDALSMTNVEIIQLAGSYDFHLVLHEDTVGAGDTLQVTGGPSSVFIDASADTDAAQIRLIGWTGADTLIGGQGNDVLQGRGGADFLSGGPGDDLHFYNAAAESKGVQHDTIDGFDFKSADLFDLWFPVVDIGEKVIRGRLSQSSFDADMEAAIGDSELDPHAALLFRPSAGTFNGEFFLVVDANAVDGFQAAGDMVFHLENALRLNKLDVDDFI